jgi:hypothetical protein
MTTLCAAMLTGVAACASVVDQSQTNQNNYGDWGNGSGQTFVAGKDGLVTGMQLLIENDDNPGTIEVYLWRTDGAGKPIEPSVARGFLDKTMVTSSSPTWYTIPFDEPYAQSDGESLAWTIELLTSGTNGYNQYGYITEDVYTNGIGITYDPPWYWTYSYMDWAFKTLVIPAPELSCSMPTTASLLLSVLSSETDAEYVLQSRQDLSQGTWSNVATNSGTTAPLIWDLPMGSKLQIFYRLIARKHE